MSHGNINHSMRMNYSQFGVDEYYKKVESSYRNPFFPGIRKVIFTLMDKWWDEEKAARKRSAADNSKAREIRILDLAAGSGEATICLQEWHAKRTGKLTQISTPGMSSATEHIASSHPGLPNPLAALRGNSGLYNAAARPAFVPPSRRPAAVKAAVKGESTVGRNEDRSIPDLHITATDPFTMPAYEERTGGTCLPLSFDDIVQGKLPPLDASASKYDLIICSFALHLVGDHSEMFSLLYELAQRANWMIVLAPHKKPEIKEGWGWTRWDILSWADGTAKLYSGDDQADEEEDAGPSSDVYRNGGLEMVIDRVRCRVYKSADGGAGTDVRM
ncbi:hypothetical protein NliqN6_2131 [Naganishia liquefaciens]|uniref:Uncharacterized protein n=1 Tax=Naganishia liquefaciens TaxID=104408 RepID=A0A8H3TT30_9TREE|nr:hypothetical protein NliqN6_2131 [Naganishia liquefaciens]